VKVFNVQSGELMAHITERALVAPVHLILHGETLYIGSPGTGRILALDLMSTPLSGKLKARVVIDGKLDTPSGFAIGPDGDLYVAERKKQRVRRFSSKGNKKGTFIDDLPDMPEFLVYVP
jgi:sugar lactone lactonase YvrE